MDQNNSNTVDQNAVQNQDATPQQDVQKTSFNAKFNGADGSEGYEFGKNYELQKWTEGDMIYISRTDGTGQVAYDSEESLNANWQMA